MYAVFQLMLNPYLFAPPGVGLNLLPGGELDLLPMPEND